MKQRFDGLDVTTMVSYLQRNFLSDRVNNVYDGENNSLVFKFDSKLFFMIESGIRFHPLKYFESQLPMPSPFCAKVRKHLRGLRLEKVQQIGSDRVVLFHFGMGKAKHTLILELYSKGNIIMTDKDYKIIQLLRSHAYDEIKVQVGAVYPVTYATSTSQDDQTSIASMEIPKLIEWAQEHEGVAEQKKGKKAQSLTLKTLALKPDSGVFHYGPALIEHCILEAELNPNQPFKSSQLTEEDWKRLQITLREGESLMKQLNENDGPGFILYKERETPIQDQSIPHADKVFLEFQPHLLRQHREKPHITYDNFGAAVEEFFGQLATQKSIQKAQNQESVVRDKLERIRKDQEDRLKALEYEQEALKGQAQAVELHADAVEKALTVVNSALESGMDWDQLEEVVQTEKTNGNPIALLIHKLELEKDAMVLRLPVDQLLDDSKEIDVQISLKETAFANASNLFARYRAMKEKEQKTIEASEKALKAAEESTKRQLAEAQKKTKQLVTNAKRKPLWFEKFHWFVTSDNYLVLGGRDAHQNEQLVKRYLRPGDAYLHADVHGASSCILRAKRRRLKDGSTKPIPLSQQALREAGNFTICLSKAWSSKMVTSAWWVEAEQVSKTAPTGEYLTVGSFMIRGKKNFLPPTSLELGLAVLFRLGDDDSISRHKHERRDFALLQLEAEDESEVADAEDKSSGTSIKAISAERESVDENADRSDEDEYNDSEAPKDSRDPDVAKVEEESSKSNEQADKRTKKGLSVKERKLIKKYGSLEAAEEALQSMNEKKGRPKSGKQTSSISSSSDTADLKRGKKAKLKKMMKKYQDQDDEDRELALLALHGGEKFKKKTKEEKEQERTTEKQKEAADQTLAILGGGSSDIVDQLPDRVKSQLRGCISSFKGEERTDWNVIQRETMEQLIALEDPEAQSKALQRLGQVLESTTVDDISSSLGGIIRTVIKYGHEDLLKDKNTQPDQEDQIDETAGDDDEDNDDGIDDTEVLDRLTGKPLPEDLILFAVPVIAPYQTVSQYAYRVKLTPGNMKRGKAAKQCVDMLTKAENGKKSINAERNSEMIKRVGDNDWTQTIVADVKISAAGASKAIKKGKSKGRK